MPTEIAKCPLCGQDSGGKEIMGNEVCINPDCLVEVFRIEPISKTWGYSTLKKVTGPTKGKPAVWHIKEVV
jgi:hypothetical protein